MSGLDEAFLLLTIPRASIIFAAIPDEAQTGPLLVFSLTNTVSSDSYLIFSIGSIETPIDPSSVICHAAYTFGKNGTSASAYKFEATDAVPEMLLVIPVSDKDSQDFDTFQAILSQCATIRTIENVGSLGYSGTTIDYISTLLTTDTIHTISTASDEDFRGHLVLVNQDSGEVVGVVDDKSIRVREDPHLNEKGRENDPVVIDVPDDFLSRGEKRDELGVPSAREIFARAIPQEERDWITSSASLVSKAISTGTNLLISTVSFASSYYIAHSTPSNQRPSASTTPSSTPSLSTQSQSQPQQSRTLLFLTSPRTHANLSTIHSASTYAVRVTKRTRSLVDGMIKRAAGSNTSSKPKTPLSAQVTSGNGALGAPPLLPQRSQSPSRKTLAPPLPPRSTPSSRSASPDPPPYSLAKPPLPPRKVSDIATTSATTPPAKLRTRDRIVLSADLVFSALDEAAERLVNAGGASLGDVVSHRYGPDAARSARLMAGTAGNVALVYVDVRGLGRRAVLRKVGGEVVKRGLRGGGGSSSAKKLETPY